jgi:hypothetical protein
VATTSEAKAAPTCAASAASVVAQQCVAETKPVVRDRAVAGPAGEGEGPSLKIALVFSKEIIY